MATINGFTVMTDSAAFEWLQVHALPGTWRDAGIGHSVGQKIQHA
ncbi:hypothetical protein [Paraburkholderia rhizosphaerae]|nr:hypothetical protein [Paraburkholderia rhizosphaerae]